ncbi:hypothetical protein EV401DRAFT_2092992 [Pisolithus croceorrhizus]|nr:hypothetical protein EV401DRAFT_2092992 [Pisolithus croceorrhizus]
MASSTTRMLEIYDRIASPLAMSLLTTHPNQVTLDGRTPDLWSSWLGWAAGYDQELPKWQQLLSYYCRPTESPTETSYQRSSLPDSCRTSSPNRYGTQSTTFPGICLCPCSRGRSPSSFGMSPKKEHEVTRMATFIHNILNHDVQNRVLHVLALDNNENQTSGANNWKIKDALRKAHEQRRNNTQNGPDSAPHRRTPSSHSHGSLTHRTVHIQPTTLEAVIEDWLLADTPSPIMFVALHACGSLTVDVLRTFLSHHSKPGSGRRWEPHSLVVVGCCYNLISLSDFPLSEPLLALSPRPTLPIAALHLATQVPAHWFRTERAGMGACLAVRKVVYRALLQPVIQLAAQYRKEPTDNQEIMNRDSVQGLTARLGLGETPENRRLGKLNDASYADWSTFLVSATTKLGIDIRDLTRRHSEGAALGDQLPPWILNHGNDSEREEGVFERLRMEGRLEVVHVLRCILGPLIESLILLDRCEWLRGGVGSCQRETSIEMVNLFDQVTGSGRNVALVVSPA